jgi:hypothetical protein
VSEIPDVVRIRELEQELAEEQEKLKAWDAKHNDDYKLAELLHDRFCTVNHTDGCAWGYETSGPGTMWETGHAHKRWLKKAKKFNKMALEIQKVARGKKGYKLAEALVAIWPEL